MIAREDVTPKVRPLHVKKMRKRIFSAVQDMAILAIIESSPEITTSKVAARMNQYGFYEAYSKKAYERLTALVDDDMVVAEWANAAKGYYMPEKKWTITVSGQYYLRALEKEWIDAHTKLQVLTGRRLAPKK